MPKLKEHLNTNTVITDASCFILLDKIDALNVLQSLYGQVVTTPEIAAEYGKYLPEWVKIQAVIDLDLLYTYAEIVDIGEASAIALASEVSSPSLIIDDFEGRKLAQSLQLDFKGTIGVLTLAKERNIIPSLKLYFDKIKTTNFRIPMNFLQTLLDKYEN